jgi:hypothetical protein
MVRLVSLLFLLFSPLLFAVSSVCADQRNDPREQAVSDALDLWRNGRFEQLYDSLSQRSGMTRERFVSFLKEAEIRPACCFDKLRDFRLINEKRTTAKVFARLGMEAGVGEEASQSREFTLDHEEGRWKMRIGDIRSLAGKSGHAKRKR